MLENLIDYFWKRYQPGSKRTPAETILPPTTSQPSLSIALFPLPPPWFFFILRGDFPSILWFQFLEKNFCLHLAGGGLCPT